MFNELHMFMHPKANMTCKLLIMHMVIFNLVPMSSKEFQKNVNLVDNITDPS